MTETATNTMKTSLPAVRSVPLVGDEPRMRDWADGFVARARADGVELTVQFSRFHVGGNYAVHGGVLPLMFDSMFGMVIHASGRPISRTGFLHVDYRKVTPIDTPLAMRGWVDKTEGRKAFVNAELRDPDGNLLAEANGLMIMLLPGQP